MFIFNKAVGLQYVFSETKIKDFVAKVFSKTATRLINLSVLVPSEKLTSDF